jgi:hypothetical protein
VRFEKLRRPWERPVVSHDTRSPSAQGRSQRQVEDDREERRWFLEETFEARCAMRRQEEARFAEQSLAGLPSILRDIWRDPGRSAADRRRLLFELWDDAIEPDDRSLGWAGRRARVYVERFVRAHLPRGSRDGFTAEELARMNVRRPRQGPFFEPYRPRDDVDGGLARRE